MKTLTKFLLLATSMFLFQSSAIAASEKGTADDAKALVTKAVNYLHANGKEKAFAEFDNPKGQFIDRDLYIFVIDASGKMLAHGTNPRLIGKTLNDLKDPDGKFIIKELIQVANTKGKGWVDYKWPNPVSKAIEPKSTYIEKVGDVLIACGIYK